ncbi:MAG: histidine phosphatase family protein [Fibrobacteres bacterium]|jgi:phosphohistidine phosphatase|nr:histidine phosphatase family protein [Fibrobacterota bacterium]
MDLLLVRHGLAGKADPEVWPDDDLRPLTPKGRKAFKAAAKGLKRAGPFPSLILTSPSLRTRETAVILAKVLGLGGRRLKDWDALHHGHSPEKALSLLARQRLPKMAALVGHEPWLGEFLSLLICGRADAGLGFEKGGAAWVEIPPSGKAKGRGRLHWLLTQDQLATLG